MRASIPYFHGDGVPTGGSMAVHGGGQQQLLQRAPSFRVAFALLNHVHSHSHVIIRISNLGFMAIQFKKKKKLINPKGLFSFFFFFRTRGWCVSKFQSGFYFGRWLRFCVLEKRRVSESVCVCVCFLFLIWCSLRGEICFSYIYLASL